MKNTVSIKENREFMFLYRRGYSFSSDCLILYFRKNNLGYNRLGITVSKKTGKAVIRNRTRRRIKENYREIEDNIKSSYDMILVARKKAASLPYGNIGAALRYLLNKADIL